MKNKIKISQLQNNQFILQDFENDIVYFQSYQSLVCEIVKDWKIVLYQDFDYSTTTSKYLHQFLNEFACYDLYDFIKKNDIRKNKNLQYGKYFIVFEGE